MTLHDERMNFFLKGYQRFYRQNQKEKRNQNLHNNIHLGPHTQNHACKIMPIRAIKHVYHTCLKVANKYQGERIIYNTLVGQRLMTYAYCVVLCQHIACSSTKSYATFATK